MKTDKNGIEIKAWDIVDDTNTIVKNKDTLTFYYKGILVEGTVFYNNGILGVNTPDNDPISCQLSALKSIVGDFRIAAV